MNYTYILKSLHNTNNLPYNKETITVKLNKLNKMKTWQIEIIEAVFNRCWGLRQLVKDNNPNGMKELSFQTGMREDFLIANIQDFFKTT